MATIMGITMPAIALIQPISQPLDRHTLIPPRVRSTMEIHVLRAADIRGLTMVTEDTRIIDLTVDKPALRVSCVATKV